MRKHWKHMPAREGVPEAWLAQSRDGLAGVVFRSAGHDNAFVIVGGGPRDGSFLLVSSSELIDEVLAEAETTLRDFGWRPADE